MKLLKIVGVLALLLLTLVACETDNEEPIAQLPQTTTDQTGRLQLSYPDGWVFTQGDLALELANNADALASGGEGLASGQIWGRVSFLDLNTIAALELDENPTPRQVLEEFIDRRPGRFRDASRNDYTFGNRSATIFHGNIDNGGNLTGVINAIVQVEDGYIFFTFGTLANESEQFADVIRQITTTLVYTPASTETDQ